MTVGFSAAAYSTAASPLVFRSRKFATCKQIKVDKITHG
jgi:hypothetical protein